MYIKLENMSFNGAINYRGLDINKFIAGTQVYDFENGVFLCETEENATQYGITENEYFAYKTELEMQQQEAEQTIEDRIDDLELTILEMAGVI